MMRELTEVSRSQIIAIGRLIKLVEDRGNG